LVSHAGDSFLGMGFGLKKEEEEKKRFVAYSKCTLPIAVAFMIWNCFLSSQMMLAYTTKFCSHIKIYNFARLYTN